MIQKLLIGGGSFGNRIDDLFENLWHLVIFGEQCLLYSFDDALHEVSIKIGSLNGRALDVVEILLWLTEVGFEIDPVLVDGWFLFHWRSAISNLPVLRKIEYAFATV